MEHRNLHRASRGLSILLTIVGATFGSVAGLAASGWGGAFVIVPIVTLCFGIFGALIGLAVEFGLKMKWPTDYKL